MCEGTSFQPAEMVFVGVLRKRDGRLAVARFGRMISGYLVSRGGLEPPTR